MSSLASTPVMCLRSASMSVRAAGEGGVSASDPLAANGSVAAVQPAPMMNPRRLDPCMSPLCQPNHASATSSVVRSTGLSSLSHRSMRGSSHL
jgi:hypothetical protein